MRLLWLYGPQGVGKSVTAWELLNRMAAEDPATGYVDIDQLGMSYVDEEADPRSHRLKGRGLGAVAREFAVSGVRTLVISGVLDLELMDLYEEELETYEPVFVRLTAPHAELLRRLSTRGRYAEEWSVVEGYARYLDTSMLPHPVVEAGPGTPGEVAVEVLRAVADRLVGERSHRPLLVETGAVTDVGGEAVLIGGTTAVGKSTVGWQALMMTEERGERSAFIDLRQVGLAGVAGGAVDHRLQARSAAALWSVFRAHGADVLILNGPVNTAAELSIYREALASTQLRAVRLTADRTALVERVRARMRGEMAALAGDTLVGRPEKEAEAVADAAVRLQAGAQDAETFPTLDTTTLDPAESARLVLSGC